MSHCKSEFGEIQVQLCFKPAESKITVVVIKAKNIMAKDINGYSDPYVQVILLHNGKKLDKKKTSVREKTLNPIYNESFVFTITNDKIKAACVELKVHDYDKVGRNEFLGQVVLGQRKGITEDKHWNNMITKVGQPITEWHNLKEEES